MHKNYINYLIGQKARKLRRSVEMTQEELGSRLETSTSYICELEAGNKPVTCNLLYKLEQELGSIWSELECHKWVK